MQQKSVTVRELSRNTGLSPVTVLKARDNQKILSCKLNSLALIACALEVRIKDLFFEISG